jgi:hypothetical protein
MPQICDMGPTALLPFRRKASWKIRRLRPVLNPRTWVPEASTLTPRPPKSLFLAMLIMREKFLCRIICLHLCRLFLRQSHRFSNLISICESLYDCCVSTVRLFENLVFIVQSNCFTAVSLTAVRCSSLGIPATAFCKEKLLIALLDVWQQNVFLLFEKCDWRVLDLQLSQLCCRGKNRLMFQVLVAVSKRHCQLHSSTCVRIYWPASLRTFIFTVHRTSDLKWQHMLLFWYIH